MKTLVLGASLKPHRFSHKAIKKLVANNHEVVAFGLRKGEVDGVIIDTELQQYDNIHTVTLYVNPSRQADFYEYIISLQPERVIFNPGTENPDFFKMLDAKDIAYEVACTLVMIASNQY